MRAGRGAVQPAASAVAAVSGAAPVATAATATMVIRPPVHRGLAWAPPPPATAASGATCTVGFGAAATVATAGVSCLRPPLRVAPVLSSAVRRRRIQQRRAAVVATAAEGGDRGGGGGDGGDGGGGGGGGGDDAPPTTDASSPSSAAADGGDSRAWMLPVLSAALTVGGDVLFPGASGVLRVGSRGAVATVATLVSPPPLEAEEEEGAVGAEAAAAAAAPAFFAHVPVDGWGGRDNIGTLAAVTAATVSGSGDGGGGGGGGGAEGAGRTARVSFTGACRCFLLSVAAPDPDTGIEMATVVALTDDPVPEAEVAEVAALDARLTDDLIGLVGLVRKLGDPDDGAGVGGGGDGSGGGRTSSGRRGVGSGPPDAFAYVERGARGAVAGDDGDGEAGLSAAAVDALVETLQAAGVTGAGGEGDRAALAAALASAPLPLSLHGHARAAGGDVGHGDALPARGSVSGDGGGVGRGDGGDCGDSGSGIDDLRVGGGATPSRAERLGFLVTAVDLAGATWMVKRAALAETNTSRRLRAAVAAVAPAVARRAAQEAIRSALGGGGSVAEDTAGHCDRDDDGMTAVVTSAAAVAAAVQGVGGVRVRETPAAACNACRPPGRLTTPPAAAASAGAPRPPGRGGLTAPAPPPTVAVDTAAAAVAVSTIVAATAAVTSATATGATTATIVVPTVASPRRQSGCCRPSYSGGCRPPAMLPSLPPPLLVLRMEGGTPAAGSVGGGPLLAAAPVAACGERPTTPASGERLRPPASGEQPPPSASGKELPLAPSAEQPPPAASAEQSPSVAVPPVAREKPPRTAAPVATVPLWLTALMDGVAMLNQLRSSSASTREASAAAWTAVGDTQAELIQTAVDADPTAAALHQRTMAATTVAGGDEPGGRGTVPVTEAGVAAAAAAAAGSLCKRPRSPPAPAPLQAPDSPSAGVAASPLLLAVSPFLSAASSAVGDAPPAADQPHKRVQRKFTPRGSPLLSKPAARQVLFCTASAAASGADEAAVAPTGGVATTAGSPRKRPRSPSSPPTSPQPWRPSTLRWGRPRVMLQDVERAALSVASPVASPVTAPVVTRSQPVFDDVVLPLPLSPPSLYETAVLCRRGPRRARRTGMGGCSMPSSWPAPVYRYRSGGAGGEETVSASAPARHDAVGEKVPASAAAAGCRGDTRSPVKPPLDASMRPPVPRRRRLVLRLPRRPVSPAPTSFTPLFPGVPRPVATCPSPPRRRRRMPSLPKTGVDVAVSGGVDGASPAADKRRQRVSDPLEGDFAEASSCDKGGGRGSPGKRRLRVPALPEEEEATEAARAKTEFSDRHSDLEKKEVDAAFTSGSSRDSGSDDDGSGVSTAEKEEVLRDVVTAQVDTSGEATFPSSGPRCLRMILAAVVAVTTPPRLPYAGLGVITSHLRLASNSSKYKSVHHGLSRLVAFGALVIAPDDWAPNRARTWTGMRRAYGVLPGVDRSLLDAVCDGRVLSPKGQLLDIAAGRALVLSRMPPRLAGGVKSEPERRPQPWQADRISDDDSMDSDGNGHSDKNDSGGGSGGGSDGGHGAICVLPSPRAPVQSVADDERLASACSLRAALAAAMALVGKSGGVVKPVAHHQESDYLPEAAAAVASSPPAPLRTASDERLKLPPPLETIVLPQAAHTATKSPRDNTVDDDVAGTEDVASPPRAYSPPPPVWHMGRCRAPVGRLDPYDVFSAAAARLLGHPRLAGHSYADLVVAVAAADPGGPPPPPRASTRFPEAIPASYLRVLVLRLLDAGPPNTAWRTIDVMWTLFVPSHKTACRSDRQRVYSSVWLALNSLVSVGALALTYPPTSDAEQLQGGGRPAVGTATLGGAVKHYVLLPNGVAVAEAAASVKMRYRSKRDTEGIVPWPGSAYNALEAAAMAEQVATMGLPAATAAADNRRSAAFASRDAPPQQSSLQPAVAAMAAGAAPALAATAATPAVDAPPALPVEAPPASPPRVALPAIPLAALPATLPIAALSPVAVSTASSPLAARPAPPTSATLSPNPLSAVALACPPPLEPLALPLPTPASPIGEAPSMARTPATPKTRTTLSPSLQGEPSVRVAAPAPVALPLAATAATLRPAPTPAALSPAVTATPVAATRCSAAPLVAPPTVVARPPPSAVTLSAPPERAPPSPPFLADLPADPRPAGTQAVAPSPPPGALPGPTEVAPVLSLPAAGVAPVSSAPPRPLLPTARPAPGVRPPPVPVSNFAPTVPPLPTDSSPSVRQPPLPAGAAAGTLRSYLLRAVAARPVAATRAVLVADALAASVQAVSTTTAIMDGGEVGEAPVIGDTSTRSSITDATAAAACLRGLVASGQLREGLGGTYLLARGGSVWGSAVVKVEGEPA
ncbi:hypothetical protein MMPV_003719 [Pyropia vietnamensis]